VNYKYVLSNDLCLLFSECVACVVTFLCSHFSVIHKSNIFFRFSQYFWPITGIWVTITIDIRSKCGKLRKIWNSSRKSKLYFCWN